MSVAKAGYVINPKTSRPVKVGGRSWMKLVKQGILEGEYSSNTDDNILCDYKDDDDIEELRHEFNEKLGDNEEVARGRGRYKNKLVKRRKKITPEQMKRYVSNTAIQAVKENMNELQGYDEDEFERELERIINEEMMTGNTLKKVKQRKQNNTKNARFIEEEVKDEYDDEDEYESDESVEYESSDGGY
jgi:hypothetical protein